MRHLPTEGVGKWKGRNRTARILGTLEGRIEEQSKAIE